jgi:hypothetical protein
MLVPKVPIEVTAEQYELKATFVSNKLDKSRFVGLLERSGEELSVIAHGLDWQNRANFGVNENAFADAQDKNLDAARYFCHPNALLINPQLLSYFRCISTFSQKGLATVSGVSSAAKIENTAKPITPNQAMRLSIAINANLSAIYAVSFPTDEKMKAIMYATAGSTIDGSWRNAIGVEGERVIRALFLKEALKFNEIVSVTSKSAKLLEAKNLSNEWLDIHTNDLQSVLFSNGAVAQFASEPDITLVNPDGAVTAGIEIKAGIDPAGALERLGAMMKSFEKILLGSPDADTILVATCITDEVAARLAKTGRNRTFILTDIIHNRKNRGTELMTILRRKLGLVS